MTSARLDHRSPVLEALADLYAESTAGTTGQVTRDFGEPYPRLLRRARAASGAALSLAEADLRAAELAGAVRVERNRRSRDPERVRVPLASEAALFAMLGRASPAEQRRAWAALFGEAAGWPVPAAYRDPWRELCLRRGALALAGHGWPPLQRQHQSRARAQLTIVSKLLGWNRQCLMRTASAQLSGSSKFLEHCQGTLETLLAEASGGVVRTLIDLHIMPNPTAVRFHGSVRLRLGGAVRDYEGLFGESALSETDIGAADDIGTGALRCVTIENATTFYELCRIGCPDLLVFTSYPGQATVDFLRRLPVALPIFHFGDTDPWGFDVLLHLRQKTTRAIEPLHMRFRTWAETMPPDTRARRELTSLDREKLAKLLKNPDLADVRNELRNMDATGSTGDFEQEGLWPLCPTFPYVGGAGTRG